MTPADAPGACLPPDVGMAGLWWVRRFDGEWTVLRWSPSFHGWFAASRDPMSPDAACAHGWRVVGPAVPPDEAVRRFQVEHEAAAAEVKAGQAEVRERVAETRESIRPGARPIGPRFRL